MTKTLSTIVKSGKKTVVVSSAPKKTTVQVADVGLSGPAGAAGVSGAAGGNYTHNQSAPSATWTVVHNLGFNPGGVSVVDSAGTKVYGDVTHTNTNQIVINFTSAFGGKAYVS